MRKPSADVRITRRRFVEGVGCLGAAVALAACAPAASPAASSAPAASATGAGGTPKRGGTITAATDQDLGTTDPHKTSTGADPYIWAGMVTEGLVGANANDDLVPVLAESFKSENGGKTWVFTLRKGIKFHNGREMTAEDVKWTFDRIADPKSGALLSSTFRQMGLQTTVVDKYTVKVDITAGVGPFLSVLATTSRAAILARESLAADGTIAKPIATGPFEFVNWTPGSAIDVKGAANYWRTGTDGKPLPYLDTVTAKIVPDATTRVNALTAGQVDLITAPPEVNAKNWLANKPPAGVALVRLPTDAVYYFSLNTRRAPFNNLKARLAVASILDRDAINDAVYFGAGTTVDQPFKRTSRWYVKDSLPKPDLAKAKQLMQEAGLGGGVDITLLTWIPTHEKSAEVLQSQLAQIGIRAKLDKRQAADFLKQAAAYEFDVATLQIGSIYHPDRPYGYLASDHPSHAYVGGYDDPAINALLAKARDEADATKAAALYKEVYETYVKGVGTPLYTLQPPLFEADRDYVKDYSAVLAGTWVASDGSVGLQKAWLAK
jgi:peptide/nickel transport system substrate-binding protein